MFYIIGLRKDGTLALYDDTEERLTLDELEVVARNFSYSQILVVGDGTYIARYEYDDTPRMREVSPSVWGGAISARRA